VATWKQLASHRRDSKHQKASFLNSTEGVENARARNDVNHRLRQSVPPFKESNQKKLVVIKAAPFLDQSKIEMTHSSRSIRVSTATIQWSVFFPNGQLEEDKRRQKPGK
jgi:hypothetical protein